jgi:hypothetical protein
MRIVQALHWLKPKPDNRDEYQRIQRQMKALLYDSKKGAVLRKDLQQGLPTLPVWMQDFLHDLLPTKRISSSKSPGHNIRRKVSAK